MSYLKSPTFQADDKCRAMKIFISWLLTITLITPVPMQVAFADVKVVAAKNRLDKQFIKELEFKQAKVQDAIRVISELTGVNIVATEKAGKKIVTLFIRDLKVSDAVDSLCRVAGIWYRYNRKTGVYIVMTTQEYQQDVVVFQEESTKTFMLKYLNVGLAAKTVVDLFGDRVEIDVNVSAEYGDDFGIDGLDVFGGGSSGSSGGNSGSNNSNDNNSNNRRGNRSSGGSTKQTESRLSLTPEQIAALEILGGGNGKAISSQLLSQVSQRAEAPIYITINRLHNLLFVRSADDTALAQIEEIIAESDRPVPQVLLEMKVLEVGLTDANESAFDFTYIGGNESSGPNDGQSPNPLNGSAQDVGGALLGLGSGGLDSSTFVFQLLNDHIRARIQLLEKDDNVKTLATPMLLASNNRPARIFIGEQMVFTTGFENATVTGGNDVTVNTTPTPTTEVIEVGNTLTILPSINADGSVVMRLVHENSTPLEGGGRIPVIAGGTAQEVPIDTIDKSKMEGTVLAKDGYTVAIGGMMRTSYTDNESKVPLLGDLPILGNVFRQTEKSKEKTELVLLITPHILSSAEEAERVSRGRLDQLLTQPNPITESTQWKSDYTNKAENGKEADPWAPVQGDDALYVSMIRHAARNAHRPFGSPVQGSEFIAVEVRNGVAPELLPQRSIEAMPIATWAGQRHFVTTVILRNTEQQQQHIKQSEFQGDWIAASMEQSVLAPAGEVGDTTYAYLISSKPFHAISPVASTDSRSW
ncbi:MAG: DUF3438 family protein [Chromatiales bacterium]|nr:DUF3438 family protein [Chromatiales bacterium]